MSTLGFLSSFASFFFFFFIADCDTASLIRSVCSQRLCFKQIRISFIVSRCFFLKWYSCGHDILVIKSDLMHENQTLQMQKGDQFKCEHYNIECRFSSWDHCMQLGGIQEFFSHYSLDQSGGHTDWHTAISTATLLAWLKFYLNCVLSSLSVCGLVMISSHKIVLSKSNKFALADFCVFHDSTLAH